jgi:hypothetical protein
MGIGAAGGYQTLLPYCSASHEQSETCVEG